MRNFKLVDSDYDFRDYVREITGRLTYKRYKVINRYTRKHSFNRHCGCSRDCCGCLCAQGMGLEITDEGAKIYLHESFNY